MKDCKRIGFFLSNGVAGSAIMDKKGKKSLGKFIAYEIADGYNVKIIKIVKDCNF